MKKAERTGGIRILRQLGPPPSLKLRRPRRFPYPRREAWLCRVIFLTMFNDSSLSPLRQFSFPGKDMPGIHPGIFRGSGNYICASSTPFLRGVFLSPGPWIVRQAPRGHLSHLDCFRGSDKLANSQWCILAEPRPYGWTSHPRR